ncbi:MAG: MSMEG_0565 family glycosyltransferase [Cyanobacteria bacterium J06626_14]
MSPLRIALLTYSTKPRGSVVHTLELAIALHNLGHEVCVYALDKDGKGFGRSLPCPVELIPAQPAPADMDQLIHQRIQEFMDGLRPSDRFHDIYHAQDCLSANAITELRTREPDRFASSKLVRTVHHVETYTSPYLRACQDRSIREADQCLCVSHHWQEQLKIHYGIHAPRVTNGIDTKRFTTVPSGQEATLKERIGITSDASALTFLTVGGIEPRKNSIQLLRAFADVLTIKPNAQLVIAGGATLFDYTPYRDQFFNEAKNLGVSIGTSLLLPGVLSDKELPVLYRTADAFVFPSIKEGWGMVILEAIASGLPIVTSNIEPFTEYLTSDQALLVDPHQPRAIAQAMLRSTDPGIAQSLVAASQTVCTTYTWERSAKIHIEHYHTLLEMMIDA